MKWAATVAAIAALYVGKSLGRKFMRVLDEILAAGGPEWDPEPTGLLG